MGAEQTTGKGPEFKSKEEIAHDIYEYLIEKRGQAKIERFGKGEIIIPNTDRLMTVFLTRDPMFRKRDKQMGFTDDEINEEIILVYDDIRSKYIALGQQNQPNHAVEIVGHVPTPAETTNEELYAIYTTARLSAIPGEIYDTFGDLGIFHSHLNLKDPDLRGITSDFNDTPMGLIYPWGLTTFVDAIGLKRRGEMDRSTSDRRAVIGNSLSDQTAHFQNIAKRLSTYRTIS